jgi:hypothetical protein
MTLAPLARATAMLAAFAAATVHGASVAKDVRKFIELECADCHDATEKKGGLDLTALPFEPADPKNFAQWVKIHDRASARPRMHSPPSRNPSRAR